MEWYSPYYEALGMISAGIMGLGLAYMCERILKRRLRASWLAIAVVAGFCRWMELPPDLQPVRMLVVLGSAVAATFAFYQGGARPRLYVAVTYVALVEICFFLAYMVLFLSDPIMQSIVDSGLAAQTDPDKIMDQLHVASMALQGGMVAGFAALLAAGARSICDMYAREPGEMTRPEFMLVILPSISGFLLCVLLRALILTLENGSPMTIFDQYPPLMAIVPVMLGTILASVVLSLRAVQRVRALGGEREARLALEVQLGAMEEQMRRSEEQEKAVRRLRHDLANTVTVVADLARHDPQALDGYLRDLKADVRSAAPEFRTGVPVADVLVASKAQSLRDQVEDATFDAGRLVFRPDVGVAPYDLGIILSNALDNAVEGAVAARKANPRAPCFVSAGCFEENGHLFVRVENSCDPSRIPEGARQLNSTKADPGHGLGLRNIRTIAGKYNGAMDCRVGSSTFTLSVMLVPLQKGAGEGI